MRRLLPLFVLSLGFSVNSNAQYSWVNQWSDGAIVFNDVYMVNNFEGYAVGTDGATSQVYKTLNGGNAWGYNWTPLGEAELVACYFIDKDHGFVVSDDSDVYETTDGGANWTQIYDEVSAANAYNITLAGSRIIVTRDSEVLYSDDGSSWFTASVPISGVVSGISFYDGSYGVVCGNVGGVAYTSNGGTSWFVISSPPAYGTSDYYAVHVFDQDEFIMVGVNGNIVKTLNNGGAWIYPTQMTENLLDVHFYNGSHGVIAGANNTLAYSTDGGGTWIDVPAPSSSAHFNSVMVTNDITAFAVGGNGEIWVSPDTADVATGDYIGPTTVCAGVPFDFQFVFTNVGNDTAYNEMFNAINNTQSIPGFPVTYNGTTYPGETDTITITLTFPAGTNSINYWSQNSVNAANNFRDTIIIAVAPQPTSVLGSPLFCPGDTITLVASGGNTYSWLNIVGSVNPTDPIQDVYPTQNITYVVEMDQGVCVVTDSITLVMNPFCDTSVVDTTQTISAADSYAFSPNYDNVNDLLILDFIDVTAAYNIVTIYNRWGDEVYSTNNYNNSDQSWDGSYNNRNSPAGTYYFIAETPYIGVVKGWVQLVR